MNRLNAFDGPKGDDDRFTVIRNDNECPWVIGSMANSGIELSAHQMNRNFCIRFSCRKNHFLIQIGMVTPIHNR